MTKAIGTRWTHSLSRQAKNIATAIFVLFTVNLVYGNYSTYGVGVRSSSLLELSRRTGLPVSGDTYDDRSASQDDVLFSFAGHRYNNYTPTVEDLNTFVRSFRRFNSDARVVIFFTDDTLRVGPMKNFLDTYNVETPLCDPEKYPYRHVLMRFFCERDYIRDNQRTLRNVMHSDTDVIFQADIFDPSYVDPQGGLVGFAETYARVIKDSEPNKRWIEDCYGREALETLLMRPRVCAGTIFGEAKAYMDAMDKVMIPKLPTCNDQGIYIVAMYLGIFAKAGIKTTVQDFAHGAVATLNAPMARVDMFGRVVNEDMRPYAAVHMAKRNAVIKEVIESQYPLLPLEVNYGCKEFWCSELEGRKRHVQNHLFDADFKDEDYQEWRDQFKNEISNNDDDDEEAQHKDTPDAKPDKEGS